MTNTLSIIKNIDLFFYYSIYHIYMVKFKIYRKKNLRNKLKIRINFSYFSFISMTK